MYTDGSHPRHHQRAEQSIDSAHLEADDGGVISEKAVNDLIVAAEPVGPVLALPAILLPMPNTNRQEISIKPKLTK